MLLSRCYYKLTQKACVFTREIDRETFFLSKNEYYEQNASFFVKTREKNPFFVVLTFHPRPGLF